MECNRRLAYSRDKANVAVLYPEFYASGRWRLG